MTLPAPIAVIGNANLDIVGGPLADWPEPGTETFLDRSDLRIGGSAANTALVLQRLGARAGFVSAAGTDLIGDMIAAQFSGPLDRIARIDGASSVTFGVLHPGAERSFLSTRGHLDRLGPGELRAGLADWPLNGATVVLSGSFAMPGLHGTSTDLLGHMREAGAQTAIDPGWPGAGWTAANVRTMCSWIAAADHILINDKELFGLTGTGDMDRALDRALPLLRPGARLVVKRGGAGAVSLDANGSRARSTAPRARVFDTIGAGDAFNAGYLHALQQGHPADAALAEGCRVATAVIAAFPRASAPLAGMREAAPT
jgi:ribokinase